MITALIAALLVAAPAPSPSLQNRAAVFAVAKAGVGDAAAGADKAQAQLTQALSAENVSLADVKALFPESSQPANGTKLMNEGLEAFDNLDTEAASQKFREALHFYEQNPGAADSKTLAELHLFEGTIAMQSGKAGKKKAVEEITHAAILDPAIDLNPKYFGPDVKKEWERVVKELEARPKSTLSFSSNPAGADVFFRGKSLGLTPLTRAASVSLGQQLATFKRPGYETTGTLLDVTGDTEAKATLKPVPAYAAQKSKMNDVIPGNFGGKQVPNIAVNVAEAMQSRFLVVAEVDARGEGKLEVWDAANGNRMKDVSLVTGDYASAAKQVKTFMASPAPLSSSGTAASASVEDTTSEPITKKWWFWTAVGVVVVGGAVGAGVAIANARHPYNPALGF